MKFRTILLPFLSVFLVSACSEDVAKNQAAAPLPQVSTAPAVLKSIVSSQDFVGVTEPKEDVTIQARVTGYLIKQAVPDGARVSEGDLLFELDKDTLEAEVSKATAKKAADQAALDETTRNYKRGKELIVKGSISQAQMDQLLSKKLQAEAAIKSSQAALKTANLNLSYSSIYSPIDGVMSQSAVSIGDSITPATVLANVVLSDPMYVSFQVSERELFAYRERRKKELLEDENAPEGLAKLKFSTGTIYDKSGNFDFVDNRIDQNTGTIKVRAAFENPDGFILPGQHVTVIVEGGQPKEVLLVPYKSIQEDQAGKFLLVLGNDKTVEKRSVNTGAVDGINIVITEGIKEGEQVIVDGLQKVRVGAKAEGSVAQMPDATY
jgi:membrane fusion protein (multidrug efflux system)